MASSQCARPWRAIMHHKFSSTLALVCIGFTPPALCAHCQSSYVRVPTAHAAVAALAHSPGPAACAPTPGSQPALPRLPCAASRTPHARLQVNWMRILTFAMSGLLLLRLAKSTGEMLEDGSPATERKFAHLRREKLRGRRRTKVVPTPMGNVVCATVAVTSADRTRVVDNLLCMRQIPM